jgi:hypothetical protein
LQRVDSDGRLIQAAAAINVGAAALPFDPDGSESDDCYAGEESLPIEPDVYPGTLTLMPGDTRQLKVRLPTPNSDQPIDIHTPSQTNFAGTPETWKATSTRRAVRASTSSSRPPRRCTAAPATSSPTPASPASAKTA